MKRAKVGTGWTTMARRWTENAAGEPGQPRVGGRGLDRVRGRALSGLARPARPRPRGPGPAGHPAEAVLPQRARGTGNDGGRRGDRRRGGALVAGRDPAPLL